MNEQYVSKSTLTEAVYLSMHDNPHKDGKISVNHNNEHMHFVHMIYHAPNADVRPVVHGRWMRDEPATVYCSACTYRVFAYNNTPYCPHCGATMDLKEATDE